MESPFDARTLPKLECKNNSFYTLNFGADKSLILLIVDQRILRGIFHTGVERPDSGAATSPKRHRIEPPQHPPHIPVVPVPPWLGQAKRRRALNHHCRSCGLRYAPGRGIGYANRFL